MDYFLIDTNSKMVADWKALFGKEQNVHISEGDITQISCDAIVSPANSFGFMDGGLDYAISMKLGWDLQDRLQKKIKELPEKELLVGNAIVIETGNKIFPFLISAPTMRVPMNFNISTSINAYLAMKAVLIAAISHPKIKSVAISGFCTGVGKMQTEICATQMYQAYNEIEKNENTDFKDFGDAQRHQRKLNPLGMTFD